MAAAKSAASLPSTLSAFRPVATPVALVVNGAPAVLPTSIRPRLAADRHELEGAAALEVVGADARLVAEVRAAAVDRAAAVAVPLVGLARAVRRGVGDDLGLRVEREIRVAGGVALAEEQAAALAEAHGDRRHADREDERADDRSAA